MTDCVMFGPPAGNWIICVEEASRIARQSKIDWSIERGAEGAHFWFEDAEAKKAFISICEAFALSYRDA